MIICIDLSQRTKDQLERLLEIGGYRDYSEAVAVAIANQELLQTQAQEVASKTVSPILPEEKVISPSQSPKRAAPETPPRAVEPRVPALFTALPPDVSDGRKAPYPNDAFGSGQEVPVDRWIWGQHNKLLPVKATCRALAHLMLRDEGGREGLPLQKAASDIASEAVSLGDYLRFLDGKFDLHRDDGLAFAFPFTDSPNGDKSRLRYANQFVTSFTKQGTLTGLPVELKLVNRDHSRTPRLLLTEAGWALARLANPILDGNGEQASKKFTDDEIRFFVRHIRTHVPAEEFAFRTVLSAIAAGANVPERLDDALVQFLPKRDDKPFTRAFLTTQRAGVVSRLIDLGLMQRVRDGITVTYEVTTHGSELMTSTAVA